MRRNRKKVTHTCSYVCWGLVLYESTAGYSYALQAGGELSLVGVEGLSLSGEALVRQNTTGAVVDETITVPRVK